MLNEGVVSVRGCHDGHGSLTGHFPPASGQFCLEAGYTAPPPGLSPPAGPSATHLAQRLRFRVGFQVMGLKEKRMLLTWTTVNACCWKSYAS